jgi:hypothetical protein
MKITGNYTLRPVGPRLFLYVPDAESPLTFTTDAGRVFVLSEMFETDLASIPRIFWTIPGFSPLDWVEAAILHDWLWEVRKGKGLVVGFFTSNRLLREAIVSLGQSRPRWRAWTRIQAWICHRAIDVFGWLQWVRDERGPDGD